AGRVPHQEIRVQMVRLAAEEAEHLGVPANDPATQRHCLRSVDGTPLSTQSTLYPEWLVDAHPRLRDPDDIPEGTTRYLADRGVHQIGTRDRLRARMPTPEETQLLQLGAGGVAVLHWVRIGYSDTRPVRCTDTVLRGDLNELNFDLGDLSALGDKEHLS
ncbi:UTRA domain-containing protein, partial [Streptomyces xiamenensis]|uniref:UTRA domain-containing protein n=1 Tax=Streptomyces xiamenensis TaxID=408015 RepID=UPI0035E00415